MKENPSRRSVLQAAGALSGIGLLGTGAAAGSGPSAYIVGTTSRAADRAARSQADSVYRELDFGDHGRAVAARLSPAARQALQQRPDVSYVEPDNPVELLGQTLPWGIDRVDAEIAHDAGETGDGADIAIIDSGIDADHPDLGGNLGTGYAVESCSTCEEDWGDDNGHGTHCAGIADAIDNGEGVLGVSTTATLHAVKVLSESGSATVSGLAEGIQWVADQGYDVGSMSLGARSSYSTLQNACQYAHDRDVFLVAAAGNDGSCNNCVHYPAAYSTVVAVSATTENDELASFSSTGSEIELAAPGASIYSTVPGGYSTYSGTSMACPHVAGAAGQLMANGLSHTEARSRLQASAEDISLGEREQGYGLVDVEAALADSGSEPALAVSTTDATDVGQTSATLYGSLDDLGGAESADVAFEWGASGGGLSNSTAGQSLSSTGSFSASISDLSAGTEYAFRAVATATDGDTDAGTELTFTTTSTSGDNAPSVDSYAVSEAGSPNPHAEITADWTVSDTDGDLESVLVEVIDSSGVVESAQTPVSGSSDSGTGQFKVKHGGGTTYDVRLTVTDAADNSVSETKTVQS